MLQEHFKQAANGHFAGVLEKIRVPEINLSVWQNPLSAESKTYLANLQLKKIGGSSRYLDGYFKILGRVFRVSENRLAASVDKLLNKLPEREGKDALRADVGKLFQAFTGALQKKSAGFSLLIFKPAADGGGFWHTDAGKHRGIITLRGNRGTLWAPETARLQKEDESGIYWSKVNLEKQKFIQEILPQDFAIFKCRPSRNPLRHATPPPSICREYRLALIMYPL